MNQARYQLTSSIAATTTIPWPLIWTFIEDVAEYLLTGVCPTTNTPGAQVQAFANDWPVWFAIRLRKLAQASGMTWDQVDTLQPVATDAVLTTDTAVLDAALTKG